MNFLIFLLNALLILNANAQIDPTFCNPQLPPGEQNVPFPLGNINMQYEMNIEVNSGLFKNTAEVDQFYDGENNKAVMILRQEDKQLNIYTDDNTNEVFIITGDYCKVQKANETLIGGVESLSINGVEHIVPPLIALHLQNPDYKEVFIGIDNIRGIDVVKWQSCYYDQAAQATKRVTYALSNPITWTPAIPMGNLSTVPVEIRIDGKFKSNGSTWTDINVVTKFRPGVLERERFWETPAGVYCPGRSKGKPTPKTPSAFRFRLQLVSPIVELENFFGTVRTIRESYDYGLKLSRFDYVIGNSPMTDVHDFNRGLRFVMDRFRGNCTVSTLDSQSPDTQTNGNYLQLKNSSSFFNFDELDYSYTGRRLASNIHTDVWLGKQQMGNQTTLFEWYFMADGWSQQSNLDTIAHEPIMLAIYNYEFYFNNITNKEDYRKVPYYYYISEYDESGLEIFDFDVHQCFDNSRKRHIMFTIAPAYEDLLRTNRIILRLGIIFAIQTNTALEYLRIADLEIDFEGDNITVLFTVLDKASFYGNVIMTTPEISLDDAVALLNKSISNNEFIIPFRPDNQTELILAVLPYSFKELERRDPITSYVTNEKIFKEGYSSGSVAAIAIVMLILGSAIGLFSVIGYKNRTFIASKLRR